ncbi:MAG: PAC2 family protein [Acidimicrobiia bacterium]|nr:PAC2 family protein [Acidimicrobiia bacterium]
MDVVEWEERPELRNPVAMVAFEGWNDAADAASGAVGFILDQYEDLEPFAVLLPEEFFNFQTRRPDVEIGEGGTRDITWPVVGFYAIPLPEQRRDLVIVLGEEPHYRWLTFVGHIIDVLQSVGVQEVITLGAFIGQVAHTLPVPIIGVATDRSVVERHQLMTSDYEGPTGITGVLNLACAEAGMEAVSLWAATPHYLAANENPKAMLALLSKAAVIAGITIEATELAVEAGEFDSRVNQAMDTSEDLSSYVHRLEEGSTEAVHPAVADQLVDEIEQFLKGSD